MTSPDPQFCYVLEVGYTNGEGERATYTTLDDAIDDMKHYSQLDEDMAYWLVNRVRCEYVDAGLRHVKWLEKPPTIRFGADPVTPQPCGQNRAAVKP